MSAPRAYFVYGTLRPGGRYWSNVDGYIESYEPAFVDGFTLLHLPEGYPAIRTGEGRVFGDLLYVRQRFEELVADIIDEIEGYKEGGEANLYERVAVDARRLRHRHTTVSASSYLYSPRRLGHLEANGVVVASGDWREFVATHEEFEP